MDTEEALEALSKKFPALRFFKYKHLPTVLQDFSRPIGDLAIGFAQALVDSDHPAEVAVGLRKLLEAKDCFVRARLPASGEPIKK